MIMIITTLNTNHKLYESVISRSIDNRSIFRLIVLTYIIITRLEFNTRVTNTIYKQKCLIQWT